MAASRRKRARDGALAAAVVSGLVGDLVDLTRDDAGAVVHDVVDLNEVIKDLLKMLGRLIGEDIKLLFDGFTGNLPYVNADAGLARQLTEAGIRCVNWR